LNLKEKKREEFFCCFPPSSPLLYHEEAATRNISNSGDFLFEILNWPYYFLQYEEEVEHRG